jgi:hypothetical protein
MRSLHRETVTALLERHAATRDLTVERVLLELDAAGYWPPDWPLARRLAHQRRILREHMTAPGVPHLLLQSRPLPPWVTGWFPSSLKELGQVFALEATVGTERGWSHPALQDSQGPFIVAIWDDESSPTPIVLYKHCEAWTAEDATRIIAHIRVQTAEQQAEVRALRENSPDHPHSWGGGNRLRSGQRAS